MKRKVQAQRKFAQGAPIPVTIINGSSSERRIDIPNREDQRNVVQKNNTDAKALLDIISFQQIHEHKRPVVLLERLRTNSVKPRIVQSNEIEEERHNINASDNLDLDTDNSVQILNDVIDIDNSNTNSSINPLDENELNDNLNRNEINPIVTANNNAMFLRSRSRSRCNNKKISENPVKNSETGHPSCSACVDEPKGKNFICYMSDVSIDEDKPLAQYVQQKKQSSSRPQTPFPMRNRSRTLKRSNIKGFGPRRRSRKRKIDEFRAAPPTTREKILLRSTSKSDGESKEDVTIRRETHQLRRKSDAAPLKRRRYTCDDRIQRSENLNVENDNLAISGVASSSTDSTDKQISTEQDVQVNVPTPVHLQPSEENDEVFISNSQIVQCTSEFSRNSYEVEVNVKRENESPSLDICSGVTNCDSVATEGDYSELQISDKPIPNTTPSNTGITQNNQLAENAQNTTSLNNGNEIQNTFESTDDDIDRTSDLEPLVYEADNISDNEEPTLTDDNNEFRSAEGCTNNLQSIDLLPGSQCENHTVFDILNQNLQISQEIIQNLSENTVLLNVNENNSLFGLLMNTTTTTTTTTNKTPIITSVYSTANTPASNMESQNYVNCPSTSKSLPFTQSNVNSADSTHTRVCKPSSLNNRRKSDFRDKTKTIAQSQPSAGESFVNAPIFYPTLEEFEDPIALYDTIMPIASKYGICKVVAPPEFVPSCALDDVLMFNVSNQYITRLYSRWGPAPREMSTIKACLASQGVFFKRAPLYEGMEVNLRKLHEIVQRHGGLTKVIERKRWSRVAEEIRFTRGPNPEKKLDQFYVKYLLPYDTLSPFERDQIMSRVERAWCAKFRKMTKRAFEPLQRQHKILSGSVSSDEESDFSEDDQSIIQALYEADECVIPGRRMNLTSFKKIASNARETFFPNTTPSISDVEEEYWKLVLLGSEHVCMFSASIDTGTAGYGFPSNEDDTFGPHPWNLKNLVTNKGNILRYLGRVLGVTVPTLHLGMIFSTSCWHNDPHGLPWMEYMHSGPPKIWYGIPNEQSDVFRKAVETLCPTVCQNKTVWLPSDIVMIPPNLLREQNVTLSRVEQKPGEYVLVFPKAYSCSISTGYSVTESVYFAPRSWLLNSVKFFMEAQTSCEPTMISIESLLMSIVTDPQTPLAVLQPSLVVFRSLISFEMTQRQDLEDELHTCASKHKIIHKKHESGEWNVREKHDCDVCHKSLFLSRVKGLTGNSSVCVEHGGGILINRAKKNIPSPPFEIYYYFSNDELNAVMKNASDRLFKIR